MPINQDDDSPEYVVPGVYRRYAEPIRDRARRIDPRLTSADYAGDTVEIKERQRLSDTAPTTLADRRLLEQMDAGEPVLIARWAVPITRQVAEAIPFLRSEVPETREDAEERCALVRIYSDDSIRVAQVERQAKEQQQLVAAGFTSGRISDEGDYIPIGWNPETGAWQDIRPGDDVVTGKLRRGPHGPAFEDVR
jgi:hypothetical protein